MQKKTSQVTHIIKIVIKSLVQIYKDEKMQGFVITLISYEDQRKVMGQQVALKNCEPFTNCITEIDRTIVDMLRIQIWLFRYRFSIMQDKVDQQFT